MNSRSIQSLQYFVNKVCSIFTVSSNRNNLPEEHAREYFVARISSIDHDGIWGTHPSSHMVSYFPLNYVTSIVEEMELNPENPDHAAIISKYEKMKENIEENIEEHPQTDQQFVDVENLENLAKIVKEQYEKQTAPKQLVDIKINP
jgi:hypothetical protein